MADQAQAVPIEQTADQRASAFKDAGVAPVPNIGQVPGALGGVGSTVPNASEPTVVTNANIADNVIPKNTSDLAMYANKGVAVGQDGVARYADGTLAPAADDELSANRASGGTYTGQDNQQYYSFDNTPVNAGNDSSPEGILTQMKANTDAATKMKLDSIHANLDMIRGKQQQIEASKSAGLSTKLIGEGTARYAADSASSATDAEHQSALAEIAKLDAKENALIASAKAAQQTGDNRILDKQLSLVAAARKQKQAAADKLLASQEKSLDTLGKQHDQAVRDNLVARSVDAGTTDPNVILKALNYKSDGSESGANYTLKEVHAALANLMPKSQPGDAYKFTNATVGKLLAAGIPLDKIHDISDGINGRNDNTTFSQLADDQKRAVQDALGGTAASSGKSYTFSHAEQSHLLLSGLSKQEIGTVEQAINSGDGSKLASLSPAKQAAIEQVMQGKVKVGGGSKTSTSGSLTYTDARLAKVNGWLNSTRGTDRYVDPNAYQSAFEAWQNDGGLPKDFLAKFPPDKYVNPANTDLPTYLRNKTSTKKAAPDLQSQINGLFSTKTAASTPSQ